MLSDLKQGLKRRIPAGMRPSGLLRRTVQFHTQQVVHSGPFAGMKLPPRAVWGAYIPKLLGTYELELHSHIERALMRAPRRIVDVGAAEGFYAVGMLRRAPGSKLVAFEQLEDARELLASVAEVNGVADRLRIEASASPENLGSCLEDFRPDLLICDVEGYEADLLDPTLVTGLDRVDMLVEVHDAQRPGCGALLRSRFTETHRIEEVRQRARALADYPFQDPWQRAWPTAVLKWGLSEFRSAENGWMWLEAKSRDGALAT